MNLSKKLLLIILLLTSLISPLRTIAQTDSPETLDNYLRYFYNRHSRFLDQTYYPLLKTWHFDTPYYLPETRWPATIIHPRYQASAAAFYRFRLDDSPYLRMIVRQAILDSTVKNKKTVFDQSFNDAIADFLVIRLLEADEKRPSSQKIISVDETRSILAWLKPRLWAGLDAPDSENRAAIAGVYWYYAGRYLYQQQMLTLGEWQEVQTATKNKIDLSIRQTLTQGDFRYREDGLFSLHYHIVETYMLFSYGYLSGEKKYLDIALEMSKVINQSARTDGFLAASLGHRPSGIGAQGYLMTGIINWHFGDQKNADKFFKLAHGNRFFKDAENPDRLTWCADKYKNDLRPPSAELNDDISFVNMAELALALFGGDAELGK